MNAEKLVKEWFEKWKAGDFFHLPIADHFKHTSPFGTIDGKKAYIDLVQKNKDKFLGYRFDIHDAVYSEERACVRYTARQGKQFKLDVSEWYHLEGDLIVEVFAYYHIGDIQEDRKLKI